MSSNKKAVKILYMIGIIVAFIIFAIIAYNNMDSEVYSEEYQEELVSNQDILAEQVDNDTNTIETEQGNEADIVSDIEANIEADIEPNIEPNIEADIEPNTEDDIEVNIQAEYHFRNDKLLTQHYDKHGIEMGFDSKESYEAAASMVVTNPDSLHKTEADDGDDVYYLEETNEFVIVSTDGYIRTYFLPDGGKKYFDKQ